MAWGQNKRGLGEQGHGRTRVSKTQVGKIERDQSLSLSRSEVALATASTARQTRRVFPDQIFRI